MNFEEWYESIYLPEQIYPPSSAVKSGIRFAYEEGYHNRQKEIDILRECATKLLAGERK